MAGTKMAGWDVSKLERKNYYRAVRSFQDEKC
jgi:hypothetical protein